MDVSVPLWIVTAQWAILAALAAFVLLLYRQLGYFLTLRNEAPGRTGLAVGDAAPNIKGTEIQTFVSVDLPVPAEWTVILFADPFCGNCVDAIQAIEREYVRPSHRAHPHFLIASTSTAARLRASETFLNTSARVVAVDESVFARYQVTRTPWAVLIGPDSKIHSSGTAADHQSARKLFSALEQPQIRLIPA